MLKAIRFDILRNVQADGKIKVDLPEEPIRVATLINEARFLQENLLIHNKTVFLEDRMHDWSWQNGQFRYFTRVADCADVLIVYELDEHYEPAPKFCPMTGKPLKD